MYKIEKIISLSAKEREKMGKRSREKMIKEFEQDIVAKKTIDLYPLL